VRFDIDTTILSITNYIDEIKRERDTLRVRVGELAAEVERLNGLLSTDEKVAPVHLQSNRRTGDIKLDGEPLPEFKPSCYECEKTVNYLFEDGRCKDCTRLTIEEVRGH
jgi:hypothetical protein